MTPKEFVKVAYAVIALLTGAILPQFEALDVWKDAGNIGFLLQLALSVSGAVTAFRSTALAKKSE